MSKLEVIFMEGGHRRNGNLLHRQLRIDKIFVIVRLTSICKKKERNVMKILFWQKGKRKFFCLIAKLVLQCAEKYFFPCAIALKRKFFKIQFACSPVRKWKRTGKSFHWLSRECNCKTDWWDYEGGGCVGDTSRLSDDERNRLRKGWKVM